MTDRTKSQIRIGVITTLIGGLMLVAFTKTASQVVLRPEFEASQTKMEAKIDRIEGIAKDVLCGQNPDHWRCQ